MGTKKPGCWSAKQAEKHIHEYARKSSDFELAYTVHAKQRIEERDIIISDITYILIRGYIDEEPEESTRAGYCKYKMCGKSPNSNNREICLIIIPDPDKPAIKLVTIMWKDMS